jgi:hypothetical protein
MRPSPDQPIRVTAKVVSVVSHIASVVSNIAAVLSLGVRVAVGIARVAQGNATGACPLVAVERRVAAGASRFGK